MAPVDHKYSELTLDVSVTLPPAQNDVKPEAVMVGVAGVGLTVTEVAREAVLRQPNVLVSPLDQRYNTPGLDVSVWLLPVQMVTDPAGLIVGRDGNVLTVTTTVGEGTLWQPAAFITCTEK